MLEWITSLATQRGYPVRQDQAGNLLVQVGPRQERRPTIIIQSHVDMVWEKNEHVVHDFHTDPIFLVREGEWIRARDTTLGADNGIGVAMMIALMDERPSQCNLDLLFTVDEECGLTGALNLDPALLQGEVLLNLDGEEEGIFYIGCAGGQETLGDFPAGRCPVPANLNAWTLKVKGLMGGHSGADIHCQRGNSIKILARVLDRCLQDLPDEGAWHLGRIDGGDKHNAIPREARAVLHVSAGSEARLAQLVQHLETEISREFAADEPEFRLLLQPGAEPSAVQDCFPAADARRLVGLLMALPHGVQLFSRTMPGLVSTSCNLARIRTHQDRVEIVTSQRSDQNSLKLWLSRNIECILTGAGCRISHKNPYPAWTPQPRTPLVTTIEECWTTFAGQAPVMTAIHAGLECGTFAEKKPGLAMISFGPDIRDVHTPRERVSIASVGRVWQFLRQFLDVWSQK